MPTLTTDRPLKDAVEQISQRMPLGSALTSAEWERVPAEIRLRAMFSARVENERLLAEMQKRLQQRLELARSVEPDGKEGVLMGRRRFIDEMRGELAAAGYRVDPKKAGGLQDLTSDKRLGLIWKMNIAQAQGYAQWLTGQTPVALLMEPAMEFVRLEKRMEIRAWAERWAALGGKFYKGSGPYPQGRMIALKNDPIWIALNRFGVPWKPFDWGSGMGTVSIDRREALALGLVRPEDKAPVAAAVPFNSNLRMSVRGVKDAGREKLRSAMGDAIRFDGDEVILQRDSSPETYEQRKQDLTQSLRERARAIAEGGHTILTNARSKNGPLAGAPGAWEDAFDEILASTSAVAVGRKQLYHEGWAGDASIIGELIRAFLPPSVEVMVQDGHVHAWRPDLLRLSADEIQALSVADQNGVLLGYGQNLFDQPAVAVTYQTEGGRIIGGFYTHPSLAVTYAKARRRDFTDALGILVRTLIDGKEVKP